MERVKTISEFNTYFGKKPPKYNNIDVGIYDEIENQLLKSPPIYLDFYRISLKFDFVDPLAFGVNNNQIGKWQMFFSSPGTKLEWDLKENASGFYIQICPSLINTNPFLNHSFLNYGGHEALFLTKAEEFQLINLFQDTVKEYNNNIESLTVLLAYCNLIFSYIERFYTRQFNSQQDKYHRLVDDFFNELENYYTPNSEIKRLATVGYFADKLNTSTNYLSDIIKSNTNQTAKEHIDNKIIKISKILLLQTKMSISEIAYRLGFDYPNYFARFFKKGTNISPSQFRSNK
ncbi:helix-turn-helix domain-containing protein [Aquimarina rhabdastrellae]